MIVKIVELGKAIKEVAIEGSCATMSAINAAARMSINEATVNGVDVRNISYVYDGAVIFVNPRKIKGNVDFIEVTFVRFGAAGGGVDKVAVAPGSTIAQAVTASGQNFEGYEFRVNNNTSASESSTPLYGESRIFLTKKIKGNNDEFIEVTFVRFGAAGGGVDKVAVAPGSTIAQAVRASGQNFEGYEFRVNNNTSASEASTPLYGESRIFLTKKIKGN